jgi:hypothetical protein
MTWNCRIGGFRKKAKLIAPFRPDILVVLEVERIDNVLLFAGDCQPSYRDRACDPAFPRRAIGVFSYTETEIKSVDATDVLYGFRRYEAQWRGAAFNLIGVWTSATESPKTSYKQAQEGLLQHTDWIRERPTVILGDFNDNASFKTGDWEALLELTNGLGLASAYHEFFSEKFGAESRPTYFHRSNQTSPAHLDYCFVPQEWVPHISNVTVGRHADWHHASDHAPLIVDLEF